jgi:hypothetical protein
MYLSASKLIRRGVMKKVLTTTVLALLSMATSYSMPVATDINGKVDSYGNTRLHIAAQNGDVSAARKLIATGANVDLPNNNGLTPLHAASSKNVECIELLIHAGADIKKIDLLWGWTPLHWAVCFGNTDCLEALIAAGSNINKRAAKYNGATPLCLAASVSNWKSIENKHSVEILIAAGAQATKPDIEGNTPLYCAITNKHNEIAQVLIAHYLENGLDIPLNNYSLSELNEFLVIANKIKCKRFEELAAFKINASSLMLASVERLGKDSPASLFASNPTLTQQFYDSFYDLTVRPIEQFIQAILKQITNQSSTRSRSVISNPNQQNPTQQDIILKTKHLRKLIKTLDGEMS